VKTSSYVGLIVGRMWSSVLLGVVLRETIGDVIWCCMPSCCCLPLYFAASVMFKFSDHQTVRKMVRALPPVGVGTYYGIPQSRSLYCFFLQNCWWLINAPFNCSEQAIIFSKWNSRSILEKQVIQWSQLWPIGLKTVGMFITLVN